MALPKELRLKGHRSFHYLHKKSKKYYGKLMDLKIVRSNPEILLSHKNNIGIFNFKLAIAVSKKVSKSSVVRNKIKRILQHNFLKNFKKEYNHIPYWVLVNLRGGESYNEEEIVKEFHSLIHKSSLLK